MPSKSNTHKSQYDKFAVFWRCSTAEASPFVTVDTPTHVMAASQTHARAEYTLHQTFLGKTARVHIDDGREIEGRLVAVDSAGNVILQSATECRRGERVDSSDVRSADVEHRWVGMVAVPTKHILDVDIKASWGQGPVNPSMGPPLPPRAVPANTFPTDASLYS